MNIFYPVQLDSNREGLYMLTDQINQQSFFEKVVDTTLCKRRVGILYLNTTKIIDYNSCVGTPFEPSGWGTEEAGTK